MASSSLILLFCLSAVCLTPVLGGCASQRLCCPGKSNNCAAKGPRMNGYGNNETSCFCDENCLKLKDCCSDILDYCRPQDCEVSRWSDWSDCGCGHNEQKRTRNVTKPALFTGKACPKLVQTKNCWVRSCKKSRHIKTKPHKETARILPSQFGTFRTKKQFDMSKSYNKNLFYRYHYKNELPQDSYCATFEIQSWRYGCMNNKRADWARALYPGARVCVECHPKAMKNWNGYRCAGHGVVRQSTQWNAITARGCHGSWKLVEKHRACSCGNGPYDFIFV